MPFSSITHAVTLCKEVASCKTIRRKREKGIAVSHLPRAKLRSYQSEIALRDREERLHSDKSGAERIIGLFFRTISVFQRFFPKRFKSLGNERVASSTFRLSTASDRYEDSRLLDPLIEFLRELTASPATGKFNSIRVSRRKIVSVMGWGGMKVPIKERKPVSEQRHVAIIAPPLRELDERKTMANNYAHGDGLGLVL